MYQKQVFHKCKAREASLPENQNKILEVALETFQHVFSHLNQHLCSHTPNLFTPALCIYLCQHVPPSQPFIFSILSFFGSELCKHKTLIRMVHKRPIPGKVRLSKQCEQHTTHLREENSNTPPEANKRLLYVLYSYL